MKLSKLLATSFLCLSLYIGYSHAENAEPAKGPRQGGDIAYLLTVKELNLTPEQKSQLEQIKSDFEQRQASVKSELKTKRKELEDLLKNYEVDREKVEAKIKEISDLNWGLLYMATISRVNVRDVLSREQFDKAKELIEKRREE